MQRNLFIPVKQEKRAGLKKWRGQILWHSEFKRSFQGRKIAMAICAKKTMSDESRYFSWDEEFVFGDFPAVENSKNSDSLELLLLLFQDKRRLKNIIILIKKKV